MNVPPAMTVSDALQVLCRNGLISAFDLQFAGALAGHVSAGEAGNDDLDRLRILAALAAHFSFTRQSACLKMDALELDPFFADCAREAGAGSPNGELNPEEAVRNARNILMHALGKDRGALLDRLTAVFPTVIHKADGFNAATPFVPLIWHSPRLYLQRFWIYEKKLADMLVARSRQPEREPVPESEIRNLCEYFTKPGDDGQWQAVQLALRKKFSVITGGPGTGKTTIVSAILARILTGNPDAGIALCAPTGKAQARMLESIRDEIRKSLRCDDRIKKIIAALPASTIHRLLKYNYHDGKFRINEEAPLGIDVLIVDEVSMVSLPLMVRLLCAVPDNAAVILLGDADQLASVETGAVLADICELADRPGSEWNRGIAKLTVSHRFRAGGDIDTLKQAINRGAADAVIKLLAAAADECLEWGTGGKQRVPANQTELMHSLKAHLDLWENGCLKAPDAGAALMKFNEFQVLCSHRGGRFGTNSLNLIIRKLLGKKHPYDRGIPVMVTRNNYEHRLFNGDVGICWPDENGNTKVYFPDPEKPGELRRFPPSILPEHEDAFAMTVHKAQGSGFGNVLLILGDKKDSPVLTRELLYTGVTRAKNKVTLWAGEEILRATVNRKTVRASGLKERLEQIG